MIDDDCTCEPDVGDDDDFPDQEPIGNTHYTRTCEVCATVWESTHCPHDGIQNPCPSCGWRPVGSRSPMEAIGAAAPPGDDITVGDLKPGDRVVIDGRAAVVIEVREVGLGQLEIVYAPED